MGFLTNNINPDPNIQSTENVINGTMYVPVVSNIYPAKSGATIIAKFIGNWDTPIIVANAFRPK